MSTHDIIMGAAGASGGATNYIEDVFSTWLYAGNSGTQTITNNIDLSTKGGMVWIKGRDIATNNLLFDTARGVNNYLVSDGTNAQANPGNTLSAFNTNGFQVTDLSNFINETGFNYASWTFRKQPKFFDVVTWSGDGTSGRQIAHSLGSKPAVIIVKNISTSTNWAYFQDVGGNVVPLRLNTTDATSSSLLNGGYADVASATSTYFEVYPYFGASLVNASGSNYVAYVFASNAGGFGLTGTDNVISCGSYTGDGTTDYSKNISLGYEPQWVMVKRTSTTGGWFMLDTMRGWDMSDIDNYLSANLSNAETDTPLSQPNATGFAVGGTSNLNASGATYIYIAIRRGPMKVPTDATKVFAPITGNDNTTLTTGFPVDMFIDNLRTGNSYNSQLASRLTGNTNSLQTSSTSAELTSLMSNPAVWQSNTSFQPSIFYSANGVNFAFQRAPSFFDEVCYTGTGSATTFNHNLGVVPELMIVKSRSNTASWYVYAQSLNAGNFLKLDTTDSVTASSTLFNSTSPTSSVFTVGTAPGTNNSTWTYTAYLFATCPGVSKVGSYTGTGTTKQIDCGFAAGARFVMIKRTDSTGDWYVWDAARGIVSGNDPHLSLNTTAAEVTSDDTIDPDSSGFIVNQNAATNVNVNAATYIYLAIA